MVNKTLLAVTVILLGILLAGCRWGQYEYKGNVIDPPMTVPDFELTDTAGQLFHLSDVEQEIALIYFGYTFCPDICPLTLWEIKESLDGLDTGSDQVRVIFISVDPERDTLEVLEKYTAAFGPQFMGLTDDFENVQAVMTPFGAYAEKEEVADSVLGYLMNHTARVYLVDPHRQEILVQYPFGFAAEDLRADLAHLIEQNK
jgi:protein SCO1/2